MSSYFEGAPERCISGFRFTEGPLWDAGEERLLFSDILASIIYSWRPGAAQAEVWRVPSGKSNGLAWSPAGEVLACEHQGRRVSRGGSDHTATVVDRYRGGRLNSPNDLVCRPDGCIYFTDPPYGILSEEMGALAEQEQPVNGVYRVTPGSDTPQLLVRDMERPNGLAFSPEGDRLYINDTPRYHTRRFRVRTDGTLEDDGILAVYPSEQGQGRPDGMKVDVEGNLYTTGPGGLWVVSPAGELRQHAAFPEKTTNCAWAEADRRTLYVTAGTSIYRLRTRLPGAP